MENGITKQVAEIFLKDQGKLFDEPVADTVQEAIEFLDECFAQVFDTIAEVREFMEEEGMDVDGMTNEELKEELEVFPLPDGRFLVVEG